MSLVIENLQKKMPSFELHAQFKVEPGKILALKGPSGCGKTTLLRCIAGLLRIDSGMIVLDQMNLSGLPPEKREMGVAFQNPNLFYHLDLVDNITFGLKVRGRSRIDRESIAHSLLQKWNLAHILGTPVSQLSGGEQRRVSLLRAFCWSPKAMLLDEPFTGLDNETKLAVRSQILDFVTNSKIPCLLVTHDTSDISGLQAQVIQVDENQEGRRMFRDNP